MPAENDERKPTEQDERELRMDLMALQIDRLRQEMRTENRKFMVQAVVAIAAAVGVGVALGRFLLFHS